MMILSQMNLMTFSGLISLSVNQAINQFLNSSLTLLKKKNIQSLRRLAILSLFKMSKIIIKKNPKKTWLCK